MHVSIIVSKFGGSSTANAGMFLKLRKIIESHPGRRYIILSAPGTGEGCPDKITNLLYQYFDSVRAGSEDRSCLQRITERFSDISKTLLLPEMDDIVTRELRTAAGISKDHTASRGEYLCCLLFSRWTGIPMVDSRELIRFKSDGSLDKARTYSAFRAMKSRYSRAVIPGFYGVFPDGSIHTFPRNGSDITGALAAAALDAELYENWSDVDGFMSADPSIVSDALFNPRISYRQMRQLAREGAQILHPDCLSPVETAGIPTLLKNTMNPAGPGTLISDDCNAIIPCVTGLREVYVADINTPFTKSLPEGIRFRCMRDIKGKECILFKDDEYPCSTEECAKAACISAFCSDPTARRRIIEQIPHLHIFDEEGILRILVSPERFTETLRSVHDIVIKRQN